MSSKNLHTKNILRTLAFIVLGISLFGNLVNAGNTTVVVVVPSASVTATPTNTPTLTPTRTVTPSPTNFIAPPFETETPTPTPTLTPLETDNNPVVISIYPQNSGIEGGITVTITGKNFTSDTEVYFGNNKATVIFIDENTLKVTVPPSTLGEITMRVVNPDGASDTANFEYISKVTATPTITPTQTPGEGFLLTLLPLTGTAGTTAQVSTVAITTIALISYTEYFKLFFFPWRKRKKYWGLVFDTKDLKPVPFVVINMYDANTKKFIASGVSDMQGRYGLIADPGDYYLEIKNSDYIFDSTLVDTDAYHNQIFKIDQARNIAFNIPMKNVSASEKSFSYKLKVLVLRIRDLFELLYPYIMITMIFIDIALLIATKDFSYIFLIALMTVFLFLYFYLGRMYPKQWATCIDSANGKGIKNVFIKLFDTKENTLADTKISDSEGRFQFIVPNGVYQLITSAKGYKLKSNQEKILIEIKNKTMHYDLHFVKDENSSSVDSQTAGFGTI